MLAQAIQLVPVFINELDTPEEMVCVEVSRIQVPELHLPKIDCKPELERYLDMIERGRDNWTEVGVITPLGGWK